MTIDAVGSFLESVESGTVTRCEAFARAVELDATVPNWRFSAHGAEAVKAELGRWYADAGRFEELHRTPIEGGELVEFTLSWEENGVPHACHQAHVLQVEAGGILSDRVWCGGRWPASLLAEIGDAARIRG